MSWTTWYLVFVVRLTYFQAVSLLPATCDFKDQVTDARKDTVSPSPTSTILIQSANPVRPADAIKLVTT